MICRKPQSRNDSLHRKQGSEPFSNKKSRIYLGLPEMFHFVFCHPPLWVRILVPPKLTELKIRACDFSDFIL